MLAALGFLTVIVMLVLIMTKKASPLVALIVVPVVTGIIGSVAATGVMFIFSILFFGILTDAGTFRPIIKKVLQRKS